MVRLKFRYVIGQLLDEQAGSTQISEAELQSTIREKISQLFGECGMGFFGSATVVKYFDSERLLFVIRAPRDSFNEVHFALASVCDIKKKPVMIRVLSVSSCNRTCREKLVQTCSAYIELDCSLTQEQKDHLNTAVLHRISTIDL